jgi:hypothetical protein
MRQAQMSPTRTTHGSALTSQYVLDPSSDKLTLSPTDYLAISLTSPLEIRYHHEQNQLIVKYQHHCTTTIKSLYQACIDSRHSILVSRRSRYTCVVRSNQPRLILVICLCLREGETSLTAHTLSSSDLFDCFLESSH